MIEGQEGTQVETETPQQSGATPELNEQPQIQQENANNGKEAEIGLGLGQAPETQEDIFTKEYIGKPETDYDYKEVTLPEGMEFNKDLTDELNQFAGKFNMSQKGANELMGLGVKVAEGIKTEFVENLTTQASEQSAKFYEALKSDPEIGGSKLDETVSTANIAYKSLIQNIDDEAHSIITNSGLVNNRSFVNAFYQMGLQMQDPSISSGSPSSGKRTANDWYPNMTRK